MTLTELRYIVAVARERHFRRAAETCFVSQPTLSVGIKKLEDELGVQIFERGPSGITVTPVGQNIIEQAQRALEDTETIKLIAREGKDQLGSPVRLGAIYTIGPYVVPELIPLVHESAPDMPLIVEENYTAGLATKLRQGELDVLLVALPFNEPGIETLPLYQEPFVVLLPASHPLTRHKTIQPHLLQNEDLLLLGAGHCFREQVMEACPGCIPDLSRDASRNPMAEGSSLETIRHMVATGLGITVLPCTAAGADRYSQRLLAIRRFGNNGPSRRIALAWRSSFPRPEVIQVLRSAILACNLSCVTPLKGPA